MGAAAVGVACAHKLWRVELSLSDGKTHRYHNRERCQGCGKVRIFHPLIIEDYVKTVLRDPDRFTRPQGVMR